MRAKQVEELAALLMFEHVIEPHHSHLCEVCRRAFDLGIKPTPSASDEGILVDIQRRQNLNGDGYFGAFAALTFSTKENRTLVARRARRRA